MIWKNKFHERINELWERAKEQNSKMTQVEYVRRLGVTRNALLGWLRGTGQPDAVVLSKISHRSGSSSLDLWYKLLCSAFWQR